MENRKKNWKKFLPIIIGLCIYGLINGCIVKNWQKEEILKQPVLITLLQEGFMIEEKALFFGMSESEVIALLGEPRSKYEHTWSDSTKYIHYYYTSGFRLTFFSDWRRQEIIPYLRSISMTSNHRGVISTMQIDGVKFSLLDGYAEVTEKLATLLDARITLEEDNNRVTWQRAQDDLLIEGKGVNDIDIITYSNFTVSRLPPTEITFWMDGFSINNKRVFFGMPSDEVEAILGKPLSIYNTTLYNYPDNISIHFDDYGNEESEYLYLTTFGVMNSDYVHVHIAEKDFTLSDDFDSIINDLNTLAIPSWKKDSYSSVHSHSFTWGDTTMWLYNHTDTLSVSFSNYNEPLDLQAPMREAMVVTLFPHGFLFGEQEILFGMEEEEVVAILGKADRVKRYSSGTYLYYSGQGSLYFKKSDEGEESLFLQNIGISLKKHPQMRMQIEHSVFGFPQSYQGLINTLKAKGLAHTSHANERAVMFLLGEEEATLWINRALTDSDDVTSYLYEYGKRGE